MTTGRKIWIGFKIVFLFLVWAVAGTLLASNVALFSESGFALGMIGGVVVVWGVLWWEDRRSVG